MAPIPNKMVPIDLMAKIKNEIAPDGDSTISVEELVGRLEQVNVRVSVPDCELVMSNLLWPQFDAKRITRRQFSQLFDIVDNRLALRVLFEKYSIPILNEIGPEQLKSFFEREQGREKSTWFCRQLISEVSSHGRLTLHEFCRLLTMDSFDLFNSTHRKPCQDMAKPLTHYFVATSVHIRYPELEREQLLQQHIDLRKTHPKSLHQAAILAKYRNLLLEGYRCLQVELVWNEDQLSFYIPISREQHREVHYLPLGHFVEELKKSAFLKCNYPVILLFRSEDLRDRVDRLYRSIHSIFQGALFKPTKETKYPTVKSLQSRFLVYYTVPSKVNAIEVSTLLTDANGPLKEVTASQVVDLHPSSNLTFWDALSIECKAAMNQISKCVPQKEIERDKWPKLTEGALVSLHSTDQQEDWSQGTVSLIRMGVQCIPLQREHLLARALFRLNGECGYVLKPIYLRKGSLYKRNTEDKTLKNELPSMVHKYTLRIIGTTPIPPALLNGGMQTRVTVKVIGHEQDCMEFSTKECSSDGLVPFWNEQTRFRIRVPDLAFFYFEVKNKGEVLGYHVIPVKAILRGNRHVPLYDQQKHEPIENVKLFVHIDYKDIISGWYPSDPRPTEEIPIEIEENGPVEIT